MIDIYFEITDILNMLWTISDAEFHFSLIIKSTRFPDFIRHIGTEYPSFSSWRDIDRASLLKRESQKIS